MNEAHEQEDNGTTEAADRSVASPPEHRERTGPGWGCAILACFTLLVVYIMSPPVVVIVWQKLSPATPMPEIEGTLEIIYFPLVYVLDHSEWARMLWFRYIELFDL